MVLRVGQGWSSLTEADVGARRGMMLGSAVVAAGGLLTRDAPGWLPH